MILDLFRLIGCVFKHRYESGRFFNPNAQFFEMGKRCTVCGKTVMEH